MEQFDKVLGFSRQYIGLARQYVVNYFAGKDAFDVVVCTVLAVFVAQILLSILRKIQSEGPVRALLGPVIRFLKTLPGVKGAVAKENEKARKQIESTLLKHEKGQPRTVVLPKQGWPTEKVFQTLESWKEIEEKQWNNGRVSGCVYHGDLKLKEQVNRAVSMFSLANPLHPDVFPFVRKMEAETVQMVADLLGGGESGDKNVCGCITSGGTESILMAMKVYRQMGFERGIETPEVIAPVTAHAAFEKAADYFRIKLVQVPVDQETFKVDIRAVRKAINSNTVALVGSAPNFPQGTIDPITELSNLALKYKLGLHVDCCLGGLLLPFWKKIGEEVVPFDFSVPGVTSISADTHKYGYAPKGSSVVLYRNAELRRKQFFCSTDWTGGVYASPTISGSRPGGLIAGTWTALMMLGEEGYLQCARDINNAKKVLLQGLSEIKEIKVLGKPDMSIVSFTTSDPKLDIYAVGDQLTKRGWNLNSLQYPRSLHICLTWMHRNSMPQLLADIKQAVEVVRADPSLSKHGSAAIYGMAESVPDRSLVADMAKTFIDTLYKV